MDVLAADVRGTAQFTQGRGDLPLLAVVDGVDPHLVAAAFQADGIAQVGRPLHVLAVDADDDVAHGDAGLFSRRSSRDFLHQCAFGGVGDAIGLGAVGIEVGDADAEQAALDLTVLQDLAHDRLGDVHGNGEADADVAAAVAEDRGIDADQLAPQVDERTTRVAGVDRGVGLDEILVAVRIDAAAPECAHDAGGHGVLQAERVADRQHEVAHLHLVGIAELHLHEVLRILDLQDCDVGAWVGADHLGLQAAVVMQDDLDFLGIVDDVVVGEDVALRGIDDDPGTGALHLAPAALGLVGETEETAEEGILHQGVRRCADRALGRDADHRRLHLLDQRRQGRDVPAADHGGKLGGGGRGCQAQREAKQYRGKRRLGVGSCHARKPSEKGAEGPNHSGFRPAGWPGKAASEWGKSCGKAVQGLGIADPNILWCGISGKCCGPGTCRAWTRMVIIYTSD